MKIDPNTMSHGLMRSCSDFCRIRRPNNLFISVWRLLAPLSLLLLAWPPSTAGDETNGIRVTDYYISHTSNDPFYSHHNLDPKVILHVREVVLAGRERAAAKEGKVLVLVHGGMLPGAVAFDIDYKNVSMMRHFARAGWDTFALDLEGYGSSTRPMSMDSPEAFPDDPAPIRADVTVADVARVVNFVRDIRGVDKVHMLGWSIGATMEVPRYAIQQPDKLAKIVLMGVNYNGWNTSEQEIKERVDMYNRLKVRLGSPSSIMYYPHSG